MAASFGFFGILIAFLILGGIAFMIVGIVMSTRKTNKAPQYQSFPATVVGKTMTQTQPQACFVTFMYQNGMRVEIMVFPEVFFSVNEGDGGMLTTVDNQFVSFVK